MKVENFAGGLSTRLSENLINKDQSVIFENIDNSTSLLTSVKDKTDSGIPSPKLYSYFFIAENEWQHSDIPISWVEFQERLYWTDGIKPKKRFGGVTYDLGIATPIGTITTVIESAPAENTRSAITVGSGGDLPLTIKHQYRIVNNRIFL